MTTQWLLLVVVVLLLALSAFFVAAEFALVSARRSQIEPLALTSGRARTTLRAMEEVSVMMACAQLGITLCGVLLGALGEPAVAHLLEPLFAAIGLPDTAVHPVAFALALLLVVTAHVALGEMVPKNVALAGPERTAMLLAPPLRALARGLGPIVRGLNHVANVVVRLSGRQPKQEVASAFTRDEVAAIVADSRAEGLLEGDEHQLLTSALKFDTDTVSSVLIPVETVISLPAEVGAEQVEQACARTGFSRFPVQTANGSWPGYLHVLDVLDVSDPEAAVSGIRIRPLPTVSADTGLRSALDRMRRVGAHLAQVQPAAGSGDGMAPLGLIALEDVLERLVGEIRDAAQREVG